MDGGDVPTSFNTRDMPAITCEVLPAPLAVGDQVWTPDRSRGVILGIKDNCAWVEFTRPTGAASAVYGLGNLQRIPTAEEDFAYAT